MQHVHQRDTTFRRRSLHQADPFGLFSELRDDEEEVDGGDVADEGTSGGGGRAGAAVLPDSVKHMLEMMKINRLDKVCVGCMCWFAYVLTNITRAESASAQYGYLSPTRDLDPFAVKCRSITDRSRPLPFRKRRATPLPGSL